jgi:hypothetical protein
MRLVISRKWLVFSLILVFSLSCWREAGTAEPALLKGKVTDFEGKPVEDAVIFIYQGSNIRRQPDFVSPKSDKDGRFSISLPPGRYWAVARVRKGEETGPVLSGGKHSGEPAEIDMTGIGDLEKDFVVADIREVARMGAKKRQEVVRITGRIVESTGRPVKMAYALANRNVSFGIPDYLSAWTDETGYYTLYLPRGKYYMGSSSTYPPDKNSHISYKEMTIEGDTTNVDIIIKSTSEYPPIDNKFK